MPVLDTQKLIDNRVGAIRDYHTESGIDRATVGVSGGVDSAVVLFLLVRALGSKNVTAVYTDIESSADSRRRAKQAAIVAGVPLAVIDLNGAFQLLLAQGVLATATSGASWGSVESVTGLQSANTRMDLDPTIVGGFKSCMRAPFLRLMNRLAGGGIIHGTGNEDEDRWLRFYQKGGDGEVDTNPLAMLSKGEVRQLALALGVPSEIVTCTPTPDLWGDCDDGEGQSDEAELTAQSGGVEWTYSTVDPATGEYTKVGTIERMSRLSDKWGIMGKPVLGSGAVDDTKFLKYAEGALRAVGLTVAHAASAARWERTTRHKMNPNCPSLGSRSELVEQGILTDCLPDVA